MKVVVIDGQSGRLGQTIIKEIVDSKIDCSLYAIGTNSIATASMMKAGAEFGATGENPVVVACKDADVIIGPIGIVITDSLLGEITQVISNSIGQSKAVKLLLPYNHCNNQVVGIKHQTMSEMIKEAVSQLSQIINNK